METIVKQYSRHRPFEEIKAAVKAHGWYWDQSRHDNGDDYVYFAHQEHRIAFNTFNGKFLTEHDGKLVTEESTEYDNEDWYKSILDFIYIPVESA